MSLNECIVDATISRHTPVDSSSTLKVLLTSNQVLPMAGSRTDQALANKWDIAISNGLVKTGLGFGVGVITSVIFFRRRAFPVLLGTGFGAGKAWAEGDALFRLDNTPNPESGIRQIKA